MSETTEKVKISKAFVKSQLDLGIDKEQVREANFPELNKSQWSKALKAMQLSNYRTRKVDFVIEEVVETANVAQL